MPRFRLFAGPNGSGKSTLFDSLRRNKVINTEVYVSADRIEANIAAAGEFSFNAYRVKTSEQEFAEYIRQSTLLSKKQKADFETLVTLRSGRLEIPKDQNNSYIAAIIASYLVQKLFISAQPFCFETVMSHKSKIAILRDALKHGYKTYLYFVFTENPALNAARVELRVQLGGHSVPPEKIEERYYRSFGLLKQALKYSQQAFLINNSDDFLVVATQTAGKLQWHQTPKPEVLRTYAGL